ncbi:hypothetical protein PybrP1_003179 [[Pythium] brassicae (nom. inval.)]|nr:hypothetical protein PybrP1_003179 [[Pythium] brassicae (nom. inval.)]
MLRSGARHSLAAVAAARRRSSPAVAATTTRSSSLLRSVARDAATLEEAFNAFTNTIVECHARDAVVFTTGIGKSGVVAQRLASSLASISVRSRYIHGCEWMHGELGNLREGDAVVILSHSGETAELLPLPPLFKQSGCAVLTLTGSADSALVRDSDVPMIAPAQDPSECPVPSRSIIAQESIVNALVEQLVETLDDRAAMFRRNHPAGTIGSRFRSSTGARLRPPEQ